MSITFTEENDELVVRIKGGPYTQIKETQDRWDFKDPGGLIGYAIGVVAVHEGDAIEVIVDDRVRKVYPHGQLLNEKVGIEFTRENLMNLMKKFGDFTGKPDVLVQGENVDNVVSYDEYRSKMKDKEV
jgi:hypothetical protein